MSLAPRITVDIPVPDLPGAACKGMDTEIWFATDPEGQEYARAVCRSCVERLRCARWAIDQQIPDGIWGGLDPGQRWKYRGRA